MDADELNKLKCGTCERYITRKGHICPIIDYPVGQTSPACISHTKVLETLYGNNNN